MLYEVITDVDEQADELEEKIEAEKTPSASDQERLAKLVTKAELLETKVEELEAQISADVLESALVRRPRRATQATQREPEDEGDDVEVVYVRNNFV